MKLSNKISIRLKFGDTFKFGDENLFSYYLNAKEVYWVYIRVPEEDILYQGRIESFSENEHIQEVVLGDVTVFTNADTVELYRLPTMYISKPSGGFTIEAIPEEFLGEKQ